MIHCGQATLTSTQHKASGKSQGFCSLQSCSMGKCKNATQETRQHQLSIQPGQDGGGGLQLYLAGQLLTGQGGVRWYKSGSTSETQDSTSRQPWRRWRCYLSVLGFVIVAIWQFCNLSVLRFVSFAICQFNDLSNL